MSQVQTNLPEILEFVLVMHVNTNKDPKLEQGLRAVFEGVTSGHVGGLLRFSDQELFDMYIKDSGLPYTIKTRIERGQEVKFYEVQVNFGPDGRVGIGDAHGTLYSQLEATISTMLLNPVYLSPKGQAILNDSREIQSHLPDPLELTKQTIQLGVTSVIQPHLAPAKLLSDKPKAERDQIIWEASAEFSKALEGAENEYIDSTKEPGIPEKIMQKLYLVKNTNDPKAGAKLMANVEQAFVGLKSKLDPKNELSMEEFKGLVDNFISIGTPPSQEIVLPLQHAAPGQNNGIEGMLKFLADAQAGIRDPNNKDANLKYNLLINNCSHFVRGMLIAYFKDDDKLKDAFKLNNFGQEQLLGAVANIFSPHGGLQERLRPNPVCTPVILAQMLLKYKEDLDRANDQRSRAGAEHREIRTNKHPANHLQHSAHISGHAHMHGKSFLRIRQYPNANSTSTLLDEADKKVMNLANEIAALLKLNHPTTINNENGVAILLAQNGTKLAAVEKNDKEIQITFFEQTKETAGAIAKAVHDVLGVAGNNQGLSFNIVSNNKEQANELVSAIRKAFNSDPSEINITVNGHAPGAQAFAAPSA